MTGGNKVTLESDSLTSQERSRYARHLSIKGFGVQAQLALKSARVLIIGAGGLGCPAALYLAAAGVGKLGIIDFDKVDESNLQRQVLFGTADIGRSKALAAADRLRSLNPLIEVEPIEARLDESNALELLKGYDVVLDGTDNFTTKFLINDACFFAKLPLVFGSIYQFEGQVAIFNALMPDGSRGPNYRDLLPSPPPPELAPNCSEAGVIGVVPGMVGCAQACEVIKLICQVGEPLFGRVMTIDALDGSRSVLALRKSKANPLSGDAPSISSLRPEAQACSLDAEVEEIGLDEAIERASEIHLVDVRETHEREARSLGGQHLPLGELSSEDVSAGDKKIIVVYCESGVRSARAARLLSGRLGSARALSLTGGVKAVAAQGGDFEALSLIFLNKEQG